MQQRKTLKKQGKIYKKNFFQLFASGVKFAWAHNTSVHALLCTLNANFIIDALYFRMKFAGIYTDNSHIQKDLF